MVIKFYCMEGSPPCALVSLTFAALGIESQVEGHVLDHDRNEHVAPEFLKVNPQHTAPAIVDDGFCLGESRSIAKYLIGKYGNNKLYPQELKARAVVDQRLDFDLGTLFCRFTEYFYPQFYGKGVDEEKLQPLRDALGVLDTFLDGGTYVAGSELTLADISLATSVTFIATVGVSFEKYPNIIRWMELVRKTVPKFEVIIEKYIKEFHEFARKCDKNKA